MFGVAAVLTAIGAVSPAAVAVLVVHGAQAGGFSPISVYGTIVNDALADTELAQNELAVFFASFVFNTVVAAVVFVLFGGLRLLRGESPDVATAGPSIGGRQVPPVAGGSQEADTRGMPDRVKPPLEKLTAHQILTLVGLVALVAITLIFDVDVGLVAISVAVVLTLAAPGLRFSPRCCCATSVRSCPPSPPRWASWVRSSRSPCRSCCRARSLLSGPWPRSPCPRRWST